jgi:DNA-binding response OmpR family regulator
MAGPVVRQPSWPPTAVCGPAPVLVIDRDPGRRRYVGRVLRVAGCAVTGFADPVAAQAAAGQGCDVLVLALDPREQDWLTALRTCRPAWAAPLLVLLEDDSSEAVARALDAGADDCLVAPFDAGDLSARFLRLLRLAWQRRGMAPLPGLPNMQLDLARPRVRVDGREIRLTMLEYRTLWVLAQGDGGVLSFSEIEARVWGGAGKPHRWALRRVIHNLRRKLGSGPSGHVRLTAEPRVGYRLSLTAAPASA